MKVKEEKKIVEIRIGNTRLLYGRAWTEKDKVIVYTPTGEEPFWMVKIIYENGEIWELQTTQPITIIKEGKIKEED